MKIEKISEALDLPGLYFEVLSKWASDCENHRSLIRGGILRHINKTAGLSSLDKRREEELLDLNMRPRVEGFQISVSHCKKAGGYACHQGDGLMGFDMEETGRVKSSHIERVVHSQKEHREAPSASSLWVAKESTYKAISSIYDIRVLSQIEVGDWEMNDRLSGGLEMFRLQSVDLQSGKSQSGKSQSRESQSLQSSLGQLGCGCVWEQDGVKLGFFFTQT